MIKTDKVRLGQDGTYAGNVEVGITSDGSDVYFKGGGVTKTLTQILANNPAHGIAAHTGMDTDFAQQYYNATRLAAYFADASKGNTLAVSGDVGGNANLGAHVADDKIHQRVPKFTLRVAKAGQYQTIAAALAAVPTSGADAPGPDQWYRIEVASGTYNESILLDKRWVEIVGAGWQSTRVTYDNSATPTRCALHMAVSDIRVAGIDFKSTRATAGENRVVQLGDTGGATVTGLRLDTCRVLITQGTYAVNVAAGASAIVEQCEIVALFGVAVQQAGSAIYLRCGLSGSASTGGGCVLASGSNSVDLRQCTLYGKTALFLTNCTARIVGAVRGAISGIGSSVALGSGTNSTVYWDGSALDGAFGLNGTLNVLRISDSGLYTKRDVIYDWSVAPGSSAAAQKMAGGHSWDGNGYDLGQQDFTFYRRVDLTGGVVSGDVVAIEEGSTSDIDNYANALGLYMGDSWGRFLRWVDNQAGGVELGYIDRDGVIYAPGFVGYGGGLTSINATALVGTVADVRLSSNIPRKNTANSYTAQQTFTDTSFNGTRRNAFDSLLSSGHGSSGSPYTISTSHPPVIGLHAGLGGTLSVTLPTEGGGALFDTIMFLVQSGGTVSFYSGQQGINYNGTQYVSPTALNLAVTAGQVLFAYNYGGWQFYLMQKA